MEHDYCIVYFSAFSLRNDKGGVKIIDPILKKHLNDHIFLYSNL